MVEEIRGMPRRVEARLRRIFPRLQILLDSLAWAAAIPLATLLRYDFEAKPINWWGVAGVALLAIVLQIAIGAALGLYRRRYHYGSFDEVRVLALAMADVAALLFAIAWLMDGEWVPRTVPVLAGFLALVFASGVRFVARLLEDRHLLPSSTTSRPMVVVGAGEAASQIVRTMRRSPDSPYLPVALVDDDPRKARRRMNGLAVEGTSADLVDVATRHGADTVLVAIPSITGEQLREIVSPAMDAHMTVLVLPPVSELLGAVRPSDIRPLTVEDLLGRRPADVDPRSIADYVTGRRVLVTGAGGSIGSELCRQLKQYEPASLVMLDRDESGLHGTQLSMEGRALLDSPSLVLADIRDRDRLFQVMSQHRPQVVFHAAALKHLPLLEANPVEGWKTNVVGTRNLLEAAEATGVARFVNISTDKAADPMSVLGCTKRLAERMTAETARRTGLTYTSVRFGNVLGSSGSMLVTFEQQVAAGGPVTVTHPDVTRYFMTVGEAVSLTIQAGALGEAGEVLVLDMGEPVRIATVARRLADQSGQRVDIVYTGLRPGEKLHEVLLGEGEVDDRPKHPLISQVAVPPLSFEQAREACSMGGYFNVTPTTLALAAEWGRFSEQPNDMRE
jgi:FlaA1/EpsC-like NDP-sugar epimerase